jgi:hypothetical protein
MQQVANGKFGGIEERVVKNLLSTLPPHAESREDMQSLVREFAIEACHEYESDRGVPFECFLHSCLRWKACKWRRSQRLYLLQTGANKVIGNDGETDFLRPEIEAEVPATQAAHLSVKMFIDALTPESREIFFMLRDNSDVYARGIKVLGSRRLSQITGKTKYACRKFVAEVREKGEQIYESPAGV